MRIVDTHLHLIYLDRFSYPWLDNVPALKRQWDWSSYWAEAQVLGIEAAIHMEVVVDKLLAALKHRYTYRHAETVTRATPMT